MRRFRYFFAVPLILLLSSCVGEEPNDIAYVTALGIDKAESGYIYTIQFAKPNKISGGSSEEGGSGGEIVDSISVEAPTIYSAINSANAIVSKQFSMAHAKLIVVSEEVASDGLGGINDTLSRNDEIRPGVYIAVAEDAGGYLEEVKPTIELNPSKYYQLTYENSSESSIPQNTAQEFYFSCISKNEDCVLPLAGVAVSEKRSEVTNESGKGEDKDIENKSQNEAALNEGGFESGTRDRLAGQAGVTISNKSEAMGLAVFKGDRYIGKLGSTEAEMYNILIGKFHDDYITFYAENTPELPVTVRLEERSKPIYDIDLENKNVNIKIRLNCELKSLSEEYRADNTIDEIEQKIARMTDEKAEELLRTFYNGFGADPLGIQGRAKAKFLTVDEYEMWRENFNASEWTFEVGTEMKIKRTGMTYFN